MSQFIDDNQRPDFDRLLQSIADYALSSFEPSAEAWNTARWCLMDALSCGIMALSFPECTKLLGPIVPQTTVPQGCSVPGTAYVLDPLTAAFNISCCIRWLDFNDTWLAAEWGHPSDNLGAILAAAEYRDKRQGDVSMKDVLMAMIKAYEIQGVLALNNGFNRVGLDHVILVKLASCAVSAVLLGANRQQLLNALSLAMVDGQSLRTYRHAPNAGSRKSWAAGDASRRGLEMVWFALKGEMGYPSALSAPRWGFQEVLFKGNDITLSQPFSDYVMRHILFKISFPAEFHAQTAVECALQLYPQVKNRWEEIERIEITTQESAVRIISKSGPLHNPADRDHSLQYMVAIPLLYGRLTAHDYEDSVAADPSIDVLRSKMVVTEDPQMTQDYLDPEKRSIANAVQVFFKQGAPTERVRIDYPVGHRRRREEGLNLLQEKFHKHLATRFPKGKVEKIFSACSNHERLLSSSVSEWMQLWTMT